jgi:hypothetical protein
MATLGISTNTRLLGLAIINQNALVDYSIHLHKSSWSAWKANKIVTSIEPCVRQYCINRVVLSIPHAHHQTKEHTILFTQIKAYFNQKKIPVYEREAEKIYSAYLPKQKKIKKALMEVLTLQYPQLTLCYHKEIRNKNKYYIKVFEAVGVAALYEQGK